MGKAICAIVDFIKMIKDALSNIMKISDDLKKDKKKLRNFVSLRS
jgi:hypothetical protein